ncbi:hypothetical protein HOG48_05025 [Candidatus Peregrinibacteria bacterium]|jgi:membrane protein YqaA with SNARE-associated domain|nr:hypothetical protein [Candidatus Peregrinibacteria bacterium]
MKKSLKYFEFGLVVSLMIAVFTVLLFVTPEELVGVIGVTNGYLVVFLLALFHGFTAFLATSLYPVLVTFSLGGMHMFLLALIGGIAGALGNLIYFYIGYKGREVISEKYAKRVNGFSKWVNKQPRVVIPALAFMYFGFTPLPNEFLILSISVADYPFRKMILPLILGNIALMLTVQYVAINGLKLL